MVTWLPVMSAGVAADVLCAVSCLACPWAIAVPGLSEPLGFSRTTPLSFLTGSLAFLALGVLGSAARELRR